MIFTFQTDDLEILQGIVEESSEHLNGIEEGILRLENDFDPELLDSIFRAMHSVKGVASFVDFVPIKDTAHSLESFLTDLKKGLYPCGSEVTDLLLRGVDILNLLLQQLAAYLQELELQPGQETFEMTVEEHSFPELIKEVEALRGILTSGDEPVSSESEFAKTCQDEGTTKTQDTTVEKLMKLELSPLFEQMLLDFMEETTEHLETIEHKSVLLENSSDPEILNAILRGFHSIKGGAGVISSMQEEGAQAVLIQAIKNLTHGCESLLQTYRNKSIRFSTEVIDLILAVVDKVTYLTANLQSDEPVDADVEYLLERIKKITPELNDSAGSDALIQTETEALPQQMAAFMNISGQAMESIKGLIDSIEPNSAINKKRVKQYSRALKSIESTARYLEFDELVNEVAKTLNYLFSFVPGVDLVSEELTNSLKESFQQMKRLLDLKLNQVKSVLENVPLDYGEKKLGEILVEEHKLTPEQLKKALGKQKMLGDILLHDGSVKQQDIDMALAKQAAAREKTREMTGDGKAAPETTGQSIRVSQDKLDRLMNMIGELLISKNRIYHLSQTISNNHEMPGLAREAKAVAGELARISDELQDAIMSARMVPLKVLFQRFPRTIRDTSRKAGKQVELIIEGEDIELDKTVIEAINDPLVHMLRNAVDHGLESPEERKKIGKLATGTVRLRAYYQGTYAVIEISDDGKGLNPDEIKFKAVKKGLIRSSQIEDMSNEEALQLIFSPGFSTRDEVSELSGRGVGMDVVKTNTEKIGGLVNLDSKVGAGTTFALKIPLSMSIIRGLMVESCDHRFVIPLDSIEETVKVTRKKIRKYKQRMIADIRDEILPLYELGDILGLESQDTALKKKASDLISVVVINADGYKYGLIIDAFQKEQEFVVKALAEELSTLKLYNGASILGDGSVVLILNCTNLL